MAIVYGIYSDFSKKVYIGCSTEPLKRVLHRARAGDIKAVHPLLEEVGAAAVDIRLLQTTRKENMRRVAQKYIQKHKPSLNRRSKAVTRARKGCYKGGVTYQGEWYRTKKALWEAKGQCSYGTFKSRLHAGFSMRDALAAGDYRK